MGLEIGLRLRENFDLNPVTVGTEVVLEQGSDRVTEDQSENGGQH